MGRADHTMGRDPAIRLRRLLLAGGLLAVAAVGAQGTDPADVADPAPQPPATEVVADRQREDRLAAAVRTALTYGEAVTLGEGDGAFLALYAEQDTARAKGTALILHDLGSHPDRSDVVRTLRQQLPETGWSTLAIQLPVLSAGHAPAAYGGLMDSALARARSGVAFLKKKNQLNVVAIGYGLGAVTALMAAADTVGLSGVVAVGIVPGAQLHPEPALLKTLEGLQVPVLDIYGDRDQGAASDARGRRTALRRAGHPNSRQMVLPGADHDFRGVDGLLSRRVRGWMDKHLEGRRLTTAE